MVAVTFFGPNLSSRGSYVRRRFRIAVFLLCGLLLIAAVLVLGLYLASRHVPAAYRRVLAADPVEQKKASNEAFQKALALGGEGKPTGRWHVRFTEEEINGWFAVGLKEKHVDLLPAGVSDPRVVISPEQLTLFCRYQHGAVNSILSLSLDVYLAEADVIAVRIRQARAGALPMPLGEILERITKEARRRQFHLTWKQVQGDPVALLRLHLHRGETRLQSLRIEAIEIRQGEVLVSGTAEKEPARGSKDQSGE